MPYHHIDLRPTIKGGSRRPGAERNGKDEISSEDEGPYPRQETKVDEPDAERVAAEWDAAMLAEKIRAANAANRAWLDTRLENRRLGGNFCVSSSSRDCVNNGHASGSAGSDACTSGSSGIGSGSGNHDGAQRGGVDDTTYGTYTLAAARSGEGDEASTDCDLVLETEISAIWNLLEPSARPRPPDLTEEPGNHTGGEAVAGGAGADAGGHQPATACPSSNSVRRSARVAKRARPFPPRDEGAAPGSPMDNTIPLIDATRALAARLEATWGFPATQASWEEGDDTPGLWDEVARIWPQTGASTVQVVVSQMYNVMRIIYIQDRGAELRYVTPHSVWAHTRTTMGVTRYLDPEPSPLEEMPAFVAAIGKAAVPSVRAEHRLRMQLLLSNSAHLDERYPFRIMEARHFCGTKKGAVDTYWCTVAPDKAPVCPGCGEKSEDGGGCSRNRTITVGKFYKSCMVKCDGKPNRPTTTRIGDDSYDPLFGTLAPRGQQRQSEWTRPLRTTQSQPDTLATQEGAQPEAHEARLPGVRPNDPPPPSGLTIVSYNTDGCANKRLAEILSFTKEVGADVVLLQDIDGQKWTTAQLQKKGWVLYQHKKVGIMLRADTADRQVSRVDGNGKPRDRVWRSPLHNSMGIALDTAKGQVFIACAYLPTDVDGTKPDPADCAKRAAVIAQHAELSRRAECYAHAVVGMDANETTYTRGRIQTRGGGRTTYSGCKHNGGLVASAMGSYAPNMVDGQRQFLGDHDPKSYPSPACMTWTGPGRSDSDIEKVESQIDYLLVSKGLAGRIQTFRVDDRTKHWCDPGATRSNYHSAIVATLKWDDMWLDADTAPAPDDTALKGSKLMCGPNYAALTPDKAKAISRKLNYLLRQRWPQLQACWKGEKSLATKRDTLVNDFKSVLLKVAKSVLGVARSRPPQDDMDTVSPLDDAWDDLVALVGDALGATIMGHAIGRHDELNGPRMEGIRATLLSNGIHIPTEKDEWLDWWRRRDFHRSEALMNRDDMVFTDKMATENPKRFFAEVTKPLASAQISSLRRGDTVITSDEGIEQELFSYLQRVADPGKSPAPAPPLPQKGKRRKRHHTKVHGLLKNITMDELMRCLQQLDNTSSAGYDGISPALLKLATLTTWEFEQPRTEDDIKRDGLHAKFNQYCVDRSEEMGYGAGEAIPLGPIPPPTTKVTYEPNLTRQLLLRILNLCLQSGDMPNVEKLGIITALPKSEGLVTSTDNMRPITVGSAINRLLHKLLADRLSVAMVRHGLIDKSQFAYIPGGDIHEPIAATTACYRDRKEYAKGCFAIYYDISKAYDTILWSSIETAMLEIGLEKQFIDFVLAALSGSRVAMRTNVSGNVTREVTLSKSIKQGCPLAPLLFIIVMDELHRGLREAKKGYVLGDPGQPGGAMVSSRGYSDDTYIVAHTIKDLRYLNQHVVHPFFVKHGLTINAIKTKVTGRLPGTEGEAFTGTVWWPGSETPFETVPPDMAVKYLGAYVSLDLDWKTQVNKMQGYLYGLLSHIDSGRLTTLQGVAVAKYVTGPRMDIGMRHADIPRQKLRQWDARLSSSLARRAGYASASLHMSSVTTVCTLTPMEDQHMLVKIAHVMEMITRKGQLRDHHRVIALPILGAISTAVRAPEIEGKLPSLGQLPKAPSANVRYAWPEVVVPLLEAATRGLWVERNAASDVHRGEAIEVARDVVDDFGGKLKFKGVAIPTRSSHLLWGEHFDKTKALGPLVSNTSAPRRLHDLAEKACARTATTYHHPDCSAKIRSTWRPTTMGAIMQETGPMRRASCRHCSTSWQDIDAEINSMVNVATATDGSTYHKKDSGAALVYISDKADVDELWGIGYGWRLSIGDNYMAELSGIHRALRSIPVNVGITVHTDSQSSIDSILSALRCPEKVNYLRKGGRPYVMAICRAWAARENAGASTTLKHVRAHTGGRSRPAIANACADRNAKYYALSRNEDDNSTSLDLMKSELDYVLHTLTPIQQKDRDDKHYIPSPVHGDIRKVSQDLLRRTRREEWADPDKREKRGLLMRNHPEEVMKVIKLTHSSAHSSAALSLLLGGLNAVTKKEFSADRVNAPCARCGTGAALTIVHRCHSCPCNTHELNNRDDRLAELTGYVSDIGQTGPSPTGLRAHTEQRRRQLVAHLRADSSDHGWLIRKHLRTLTFDPIGARARAVNLDTIDQLHQYALLYNLASNRLAHEGLMNPTALDQLAYTVSPPMSSHLLWLVNDIGGESPRTQSPPLRQLSRWVLRTYSDLYLNPLTATAPWNDTWHSRHPDGWKVGGTASENATAFLTNRYTWVSMRADPASQAEDVEMATQAAKASDRPCRVALLTYDSDRIRSLVSIKVQGVRKHILITISPQSSPAFHLDNDEFPRPTETRALRSPQAPLSLIVIENAGAPPYSLSHIQAALGDDPGMMVHAPPHELNPPPPDVTPPGLAKEMKDRHHPLLHSSQTWCRAAHHYTLPPPQRTVQQAEQRSAPIRKSASDSLHPILGLLGSTPKGLGPDIASHSEISPTPPDTLHQISVLVLKTSVNMYRRSETFSSWKRKT